MKRKRTSRRNLLALLLVAAFLLVMLVLLIHAEVWEHPVAAPCLMATLEGTPRGIDMVERHMDCMTLAAER